MELLRFLWILRRIQAGYRPDGTGQPERLRLIRAKYGGKARKPGAQSGKTTHPGLSHVHSFSGGMVGEQNHGHGSQQCEQIALQLGLTAPAPVVVDQVRKPE